MSHNPALRNLPKTRRELFVPGQVFRTDTPDDEFYGTDIYIHAVNGDMITLIFADDGGCQTFDIAELPYVVFSTIRRYNPNTDPDYIGMVG